MHLRSLALLLAPILGIACGGATPEIGLSHPPSTDVTARTALGPVEGSGTGADEQRRLSRIAEMAAGLGNRGVVIQATERALSMARVDAATATGTRERRAAGERLERARRRAIEVGRRYHAPGLVTDATRDAAPDTAEARAFVRAVRQLGHVTDEDRRAVVRLAPDDVALLVHVERHSHGPPLTSLEQRTELGATDLLDRHLDSEIASGDLDGIRRAAEALVAADALSPVGRIALVYLSERTAGRIGDGQVLKSDVLLASPDPAGFARLERARREHPRSVAIAAALAHRYLDAGLGGDAYALLRELEDADWIEPEGRSLLDSLAALARLRAGDLSGYRHWAERAGADASPWFTDAEAALWNAPAPALKRFADRALRRSLERDYPTQRISAWRRATRVAIDPRAPADLRREALAELRRQSLEDAEVIDSCRADRLRRPACEERLEALYRIQNTDHSEIGGALAALTDVGGFAPRWLWTTSELYADDLRPVRTAVEDLAGTRVATTEPYVYARVLSALADGEVEAAIRHFEAGRPLLSARTRLTVALGIDDARAGRDDTDAIVDALLTPPWPPPPLDDEAPEADALDELRTSYPGNGHTARMARLLHAWHRGWAEVARDEAVALARTADVSGRAYLSAYAVLAALAAGDDTTADEMLDRLEQQDPAPAVVALVRAEVAAAADRWDRALDDYRLAVRAWPDDDRAAAGYLRALVTAHPGKRGARLGRAFIAATDAGSVSWLQPLYIDGTIEEGAELARYLDARRDGEVAADLGRRAATLPEVARSAAAWFRRSIDEADDGAEAAAIAERAASILRSADAPAGSRHQVAWLLLLAGRGDAARYVATSESWSSSEPLGTWQLVVVLAGDRSGKSPAIDDELAWQLWRHAILDDVEPLPVARALLDARDRVAAADRAACRLLIDASLADQAAEPCARAWRDVDLGIDGDLAAAVTWLILERPGEMRRVGLAPTAVFDRARIELPARDNYTWCANEAAYWERQGDSGKASAAWRRAVERGYQLGAGYPSDDQLPALTRRGSTMRYAARQAYAAPKWRRLQLARLALNQGNVDAAGWYLAATGAVPTPEDDRQLRFGLSWVTSTYELAVGDHRAGAIDADGIHRWMLDSYEMSEAEAREFRALYPESNLGRLGLMVTALELAEPGEEMVELARELGRRVPDSPLAMTESATILERAGRSDLADAMIERARNHHPDDVVFSMFRDGADEGANGWTSNPDTLARELEALREQGFADVDVQRVVGQGYEMFLPDDFVSSDDLDTFLTETNVRVVVKRIATPGCPGPWCVRDISSQMAARGAEVLWRRNSDRGTGVLFRTPGGDVLMEVLRSEGQAYGFVVAGSPVDLERRTEAVAVARATLRPTDRALPQASAEALRDTMAGMPPAAVRLAARRAAFADDGDGCPIAKELARADGDGGRAALIVDVALAAGTPDRIRRVLSCAGESSEGRGALALVAASSGDPRALRRARRWAAKAPDELAAAARTAIAANLDADRPFARGGFGWLQVLEVLPDEQARELADDLFRSTHDELKATATLGFAVAPEHGDADVLRAEVRRGPARWARMAAHALTYTRLADAASLRAVRHRLDRMRAPLDDEQRHLVVELASALAAAREPADRERLERAVRMVQRDVPEGQRAFAEWSGERLQQLRDAHAASIVRARGSSPTMPSDVERLASLWNRIYGPPGEPLGREELSLPLAELLDDDEWSFARIDDPAALITTAHELAARDDLGGPAGAAQRRARSLVERTLLQPENGLDLTRPIECASRVDAPWVCSAYVTDADAVRAALSTRGYGENSAVAIPLELMRWSGHRLADALLAPPDDDADVFGGRLAIGGLVEERAWRRVEIGGHRIERQYVATAEPTGSVMIDIEDYLFVGDRLLVFSRPHLTREVLHARPENPLAAQPTIRALHSGDSRRATLGASMRQHTPVDTADPVPVHIELSADGAHHRLGAGSPALDAALEHLPDGAGLTIASTLPWSDALAEIDHQARAPSAPPAWMFEGPFAFGWYEAGTANRWQRWVAVVPWSNRVRAALREEGVRLRADAVAERDGLHYGRRGRYLVVGPRADDIRTP